MGRRGPAPTPVEVKRARGETRPSRVGRAVPTPRRKAPTIPADLDPAAAKVWLRLMREMPVGVIRAADRDILRAYCDAVALYERDVALLYESRALVLGARSGDLVKNPAYQMVRESRDAIRLLARELGATPAARTALAIDGGFGPSDEWESDIERELGPSPRQLRLVDEG